VVTDALGRSKDDPGAVFEANVLRALQILRDLDPGEWTRVKRKLPKPVSLRDLERAMRAERSHTATRTVPQTAGSVLGACPAPGFIVPVGYELAADYTAERRSADGKETTANFAYSPILITALLRDRETGMESLRLAWLSDGKWRELDVDRGVAFNPGTLQGLASQGFPIGSVNAARIAAYLHHAEEANRTTVPCLTTTSHLGWQGNDGADGFLWGRSLIADSSSAATTIQFRGEAGGDEQVADGYHASGTLDDWAQSVASVRDHKRVMLFLYLAFAPVLLLVLRAKNFVVDLCGRTTSGKTTTLNVSASVWGDPAETVQTWYSTKVRAERVSAVIMDLPVIFDESQLVEDDDIVDQVIYGFSSGRGKGRGSVKGMEETRPCRAVLLSSGEMPLTARSQAGGTRTRCLEVRGMPFGAQSDETARLTAKLNQDVRQHFGHAGPAVARHVIGHRHRWPEWREEYEREVTRYTNMSLGVPEARRLAESYAVIAVAVTVAHEALQLPWSEGEARASIDAVWSEVVGEARDAAGDERALRDVLSWANARQQTFHGRADLIGHTGDEKQPSVWSGRWDDGKDWTSLAFYPTVLNQVLRDLGYQPEGVLAAWRDSGKLDTRRDRSSRYTKQVRVAGGTEEMVVIKREAFDGLEEELEVR
jgi:hypothetical protein